MAKHKTSGRENRTQRYSAVGDRTDMIVNGLRCTQVDKGWAWVVMFATFWCHFICGGLQHTGGIIRYALQKNISKENLHFVSWLASIYSGLISLTGPLSGLMVHKLGCRATVLIGASLETVGFVGSYLVKDERMFFLTYSFMAGTGSGISYTAIMIAVSYNFDKYLSLASGISVSGQGVGLFLVALLLNYFFEHYGLKITFLVMASLSLQKWVFGSLLWPSNIEMAQTNRFWCKEAPPSHPDGNKKVEGQNGTSTSTLMQLRIVLSNFKFLNFLFCILCASMAESMVYLMLPGYMISKGTSENEAALVLSLVGVNSMLTRPLMGFLANSKAADIFLLYLAPYGMLAVFTLLLPFYVHLFAGRIIYGIFFGLYNCSVYALLNQLTVQIMGLDYLSTAFGLEMFIWGMSGILGTPLADLIVGWTGSFSSAFVFAGLMYALCAIAAFFLPMDHQRKVAETEG